MKSKTIKFLIICGIVFCLGAVATIVGLAAGGVQKLDQVGEKYDWFSASAGELSMAAWESEDISELHADGNLDVYIFNANNIDGGIEYIRNNIGSNIGDMLISNQPQAGKAYVFYGENVGAPDFAQDGSTLTVSSYWEDGGMINMDFDNSDGPATPMLVMFVDEDTMPLSNIEITTDNCDTFIDGIAWANCEILSNYGDVELNRVTSKALKIESDNGDIELRGGFYGATDIQSNWSDIDFCTSLQRSEYGLDLQINDGSVEIDGGEIEAENYGTSVRYVDEGTPNKLIINGECTDCDLLFNTVRED